MAMFCNKCSGSGKILGNGMITSSCINCTGSGKVEDNIAAETSYSETIDIKSKAYKDAIKEIMQLHPDISRKEAARMFRETFDKV